MSMYGGIVNFSGAAEPVRQALNRALSSWGGAHHVHAGARSAIGLHTADAAEPVPLTLACSGDEQIWVVGDARFDNRRGLQKKLKATLSAVRPVTVHAPVTAPSQDFAAAMGPHGEDAVLALAAYVKWGVECATQLRGAFSFALWDAHKKRLVGVRDQAGVRSFFYHVDHKGNRPRFDFASDLLWVLKAHPGSTNVNVERLGDFLAGLPGDPAATFYDGIRRLPAGHVVVADPGGVNVRSYWSVRAARSRTAATDATRIEGFREAFDRAVKARTPEAWPAGVFLSGGLDSSSIAVTASQQGTGGGPVHSISAVYDRLEKCDERQYINDVLQRGRFARHFVQGEVREPLRALRQLLDIHKEPFFAPNMGVSMRLYETAKAHRVGTVLHGHGGDEVVSQGYGRLKELARDAKWIELARELRGAAQIAGGGTWYGMLWQYFERYAIHSAAEQSAFWARGARKIAHLAQSWSRPHQSDRITLRNWKEWVRPDFASAIGLEERVGRARQVDPRGASDEAERHARVLADPRQPHALETIARTGRHFGVETAFPFWDVNLVEYCLSLPSDQKMRDGWGRWILRQSMGERLPSSVQWRRDKTDFTANLRYGLSHERERLNALFLDDLAVAKEYLQAPVFRDLRGRFISDTDACTTGELFLLWKGAVLILWLRDVRQLDR
jgi:asparagine synthase (glutamine-hydrolysing)